MTSSLWRFGITLAFLGIASTIPTAVGAQYLTQWGSFGSGNGQFSFPAGVATNSAGDVYVVDSGNNRVQKFTSVGTFLIQWGSSGNGNGQFDNPIGVAVDAAGNVYVADLGNHRIQKFTGAGAYLTQWGSYGAGSGEFSYPVSVTTNAAGDVYVGDSSHRIQKFTGAGAYLTQWGSFGSGDGQFKNPTGLATDAAGNVYVADRLNNRIQKFTGDGAYLAQWGSVGCASGHFRGPCGVAIDAAGDIYVAEVDNNRIQKFTGAGDYLMQWGSPGNGDGQFSGAFGVATDGAGHVYVVDQFNHRVQKFDPASIPAAKRPPLLVLEWGSSGSGPGQFSRPFGVATDPSGNVYVVDQGNSRVQKFTDAGVFTTEWGSAGSGNGQFLNPLGIATDGSSNVYVADFFNRRIEKFTSDGTFITKWNIAGLPTDIVVDPNNVVYVTDYENDRIQKFTTGGALLGTWGVSGSSPGQIDGPQGIGLDSSGNVYITEFFNNRVQAFTSGGVSLTVWGAFGSGDGQFNAPVGIDTDADGNVYVVDSYNNRVQKFTSTGTFLTKWGCSDDFFSPNGIDVHGSFIYVAGGNSQRILKYGQAPAPPPPIAMAFDFTPNTLNLASQGRWVTGFLEPASPFAASDIDISSIRLNATVPVDPAAPAELGDHDGNGVSDLMVKFDRTAVELKLSEGDNAVNITGTLGSDSFSGADNVRAIRAVVSAPVAGSHLTAGSVTQVRWQIPTDVTIESVALLYSLDGGDTWNLIAHGQPNTGSYDWTLPDVQTDRAKVAVEMVEPTDGTVEGVLGVSEVFSIDALVGVGDGAPAQLALRGITPNPARHELRVSFSLVDSKAASLALFDVSGRQIAARRVDGMGPGWHSVTLSERSSLPAGLYIIRLSQGGRSLTTRAAVVR
jgi:sugar lactone lactonase YvrE